MTVKELIKSEAPQCHREPPFFGSLTARPGSSAHFSSWLPSWWPDDHSNLEVAHAHDRVQWQQRNHPHLTDCDIESNSLRKSSEDTFFQVPLVCPLSVPKLGCVRDLGFLRWVQTETLHQTYVLLWRKWQELEGPTQLPTLFEYFLVFRKLT